MRVCTGRVWGYADEVDWFVRQCEEFARMVKARRPDSGFSFEELGTKVIGERGWFHTRIITKTEYKFRLDHEGQEQPLADFLDKLRNRMS